MARQGEWLDGQPWPGPVIDPDNPITVGLKACWLCNLGAGNALPELVTGTQGVLSGATPPAWSASRKGTVLSFDGSTGYVTSIAPTGYFDFISSTLVYSLAARFKLTDYTAAGDHAFLSSHIATASNTMHFGYNANFSAIRCTVCNGSGTVAIDSWADSVVADNGWHAAVATAAGGSTGNVYYDGYDRTDFNGGHGTVGGALANQPDIGRLPATNVDYFGGQIDCIMAWNRALSPAEAQSWCEDPYQVFAKTPFWMALIHLAAQLRVMHFYDEEEAPNYC